MVNLIASIFIKNNVEFTNRHDCWPKQTLSEIACFRKLCQNLFDELLNYIPSEGLWQKG